MMFVYILNIAIELAQIPKT